LFLLRTIVVVSLLKVWRRKLFKGVYTRVQKPWSTTPASDRWHRRMDWDEDQRSGCSSGRSW